MALASGLALAVLAALGPSPAGSLPPALVVEHMQHFGKLKERIKEVLDTKSSGRRLLNTAAVDAGMRVVHEIGALVQDMAMQLVQVQSECQRLLGAATTSEVMAQLGEMRTEVRKLASAPHTLSGAPGAPSLVAPVPAPRRGVKTFAQVASERSRPARDTGVVVVEPMPGTSDLETAELVKSKLQSSVNPGDDGWVTGCAAAQQGHKGGAACSHG